MFETPFTRRQMIDVVQQYLLPWAWQRAEAGLSVPETSPKRLLLLQPPFKFPPEVKVVERVVSAAQMRRGKPAPGHGSFSSRILWPELGLHSIPFAWLGFLFQGEIDLRIGSSPSLKFDSSGSGKIQIVTLQSPSFFVIPPGVPHPDGHQIPWERPLRLLKEEPRIFWVHVSPSGLRCHLSRLFKGDYQEEFFVLLNHEPLNNLAKLFLTEVQRPQPFPLVVEAALLSLVLEINQCLLGPEEEPVSSRTTIIPTPVASPNSLSTLSPEPRTVTTEAAKRFIETRLNWRTLTLEMVAHHVHVSASHLNRLFKAELGMTVKVYIHYNRINVAKALLEESDMAISEVGFLSGFFPPSHFARAFSQATGITPKKFRASRRSVDVSQN